MAISAAWQKRINNRLRPAELGNYMDSKEREYLPSRIPQMLSFMDLYEKGLISAICGAQRPQIAIDPL